MAEQPTIQEAKDAIREGVSEAGKVVVEAGNDMKNRADQLGAVIKNGTDPAAKLAEQKANEAYNEYVKPHVDRARKAIEDGTDTVVNSEVGKQAAETGKQAADKVEKAASPIVNGVKNAASEVNEQSGGFLEKNKGLLFGGMIALFALFGMEGGFLPMALAAVFLVGGGMADDKGILSGLFGGAKKALGVEETPELAQKTISVGLEPEKTRASVQQEDMVASVSPHHGLPHQTSASERRLR